jgi:hypothetical protein
VASCTANPTTSFVSPATSRAPHTIDPMLPSVNLPAIETLLPLQSSRWDFSVDQ